jgi:hypothetical protein
MERHSTGEVAKEEKLQSQSSDLHVGVIFETRVLVPFVTHKVIGI